MKGKKGKFLLLTLIFVLALSIFNFSLADAASVASGEISVNIFLTGTPPADSETYKVLVQATSLDFPLTGADSQGLLAIEIEGDGTSKLPAIEFDKIGVYSYKIWQESGEDQLASYDQSIYNMVIYITNEEDGLTSTILLYKNGEETKFDQVDFANYYESPLVPASEIPQIVSFDKPKPLAQLPKTGSASIWLYPLMGLTLLALGFIFGRKWKTE